MLKRIFAMFLALILVFSLCACGGPTLHCDRCGKEVTGKSNMDEEWIIFCAECEEEIGPIVE